MIILGDIASPNAKTSQLIEQAVSDANFGTNQTVLFNLEGLITDAVASTADKPVLFNHPSVLNAFKSFENKIAAIANNHTLDLPQFLDQTKELLSQNNYECIGAGSTTDANFESVVVKEDGYNVHVINSCWDFLLYHQNTKISASTINVIDELHSIKAVKRIKSNDQNAKVVLYFHWSFDLETLPFPAYRRFSKALIDAGASLVVGAHSHCIQGGEQYKDGYIAYGLGNFFIPNNIYANGKLTFPEMSNKGWALEWNIAENRILNHWFEYALEGNVHSLKYLGSDAFENSPKLQKFSPFAPMSDSEYDVYFKKNRRKKKLIPVFYTFEPSFLNTTKMRALKFRAKFARFLAEKGIINWQN